MVWTLESRLLGMRLVPLVFVLATVVLSGCGAGAANQGAPEDKSAFKEKSTRTNAPKSTTVPQEDTVVPDRPPDSTLTYDGRTMKGKLGSYCGTGGCADSALSLTMTLDTLEVPADAKMIFEYGGQGVNRIKATAYPARNGRIDYPDGARALPKVKGQSKVEVPAKLPPGEYFLDVFVQLPQGDATYYFGVVVKR